MKKGDNWFIYPNKLLINGYTRSAIYDISQGKINFIPNELFRVIKKNSDIPNEYIHYLIKEKIIYSSKKKLFSELSNEWKSPSLISNTIFSITNKNLNHLDDFSEILDDLLCKNLQLRIDSNISCEQIENLLAQFNESSLLRIELVFFKRSVKFEIDQLRKFCELNPRVLKIVIEDIAYSIEYLDTKKVISVTYCEFKDDFILLQEPNFTLYNESQLNNTYYNRKLYIGKNGEIKNASECNEEIGFINNIKHSKELKKIINNPIFKRYWTVQKDAVDICKDCEFRHMCIDSRLPFARQEGSWYHQEECNYNPYISKWKWEEGYQDLKAIGVISGKKIYHRDDEKIATINKVLWSN